MLLNKVVDLWNSKNRGDQNTQKKFKTTFSSFVLFLNSPGGQFVKIAQIFLTLPYLVQYYATLPTGQ